MKRALGIAIFAAMFAAWFSTLVVAGGVVVAAICVAGTAGLLALMFLAVWLVTS